MLSTSTCPDPICTLAGWALSTPFPTGGTWGSAVKQKAMSTQRPGRLQLNTANSVLLPLSQAPLDRKTAGGLEVIPKVLLVTLAPTNRCFLADERNQAVAQDDNKAIILIQLKIKEASGPSRGKDSPGMWLGKQNRLHSGPPWLGPRPASRLTVPNVPGTSRQEGKEDPKCRQFCFHYETTRP